MGFISSLDQCTRVLPFSATALFVFALAPAQAVAQAKYDPGATDTEIKIGNIMPYTGAFSEYGRQPLRHRVGGQFPLAEKLCLTDTRGCAPDPTRPADA